MIDKTFIIVAIIAILGVSVILFANQFLFNQPTGQFIQPQLNDDEIIDRIKSFSEVSQYSELPATVKFISLQEVNSLAKKYPVIYGNVSTAVYEVRFSSGNSGLLVLYDLDANKILKQFEIVGVSLS